MIRTGWQLPTFALLTLLGVAPITLMAGPQTQWKLANFTWVKRVPAEAGAAANHHPATVSQEALAAALGSVQTVDEGQQVPLFAKEEAAALAKALREALALAQPGEDLILLSTQKQFRAFMDPSLGLTARLFLRDGVLNLIVHDARLPFMDRYLAENTLPDFVYGSRKAASNVSLSAPDATRLRADWLGLLLAAPAPVAAPVPTPAVATASPMPAPVAPTPEPLAVKDAAFYEAQTQRLKALKRMRDENVLSEAEYQQKREAILKTL